MTDSYSALMETIFRHLRFSSYGMPSPTRGRVCNLSIQLLLGLASAVTLGSKPLRTRDHILLSHLRLSSLSVASYYSQGYGGGIPTHLHRVNWPSLYSFGAYLTENIGSSSSSIIACVPVSAIDEKESFSLSRHLGAAVV
jgi:hypothetical protein